MFSRIHHKSLVRKVSTCLQFTTAIQTQSKVSSESINNAQATALLSALYPDKYGVKLTKKQRRRIVDEASSIYHQINGPKSLDVIHRTLKLYLHLGHSTRITTAWNDIISADKSKLEYSLIIKCCIDSNHTDHVLQALEWMESSNNYSLHIHDKLITKLIAKTSYDLKNIVMIHRLIHNGFMTNNNVFVKTALMTAYSNLNEVDAAHKVFRSIHESDLDIICITTMMKIFIDHKQYPQALELYDRIDSIPSGTNQSKHHRKINKDDICHSLALSACSKLGDISKGRSVMEQMESLESSTSFNQSKSKITKSIHSITAMIDFYGKSGDVDSARSLFDDVNHGEKDDVVYGAMMKALVLNDHSQEALDLYDMMMATNSRMNSMKSKDTVNEVVHLMAIKAVTKLKHPERAKLIHSQIRLNLQNTESVKVKNALIPMYSACDDLETAEEVFESIVEEERDIISISSMMQCYSDHDEHHKAVTLYKSITDFTNSNSSTICIDTHCLSLALRAFTAVNNVEGANAVYIKLNENSDDINSKIALIEFHGMNSDTESALNVYNAIPDELRNSQCTNAILSVLIDSHCNKEALDIYHHEIRRENKEMDKMTHSLVLRAVGNLKDLESGQSIHEYLKRKQPEILDLPMMTMLIDFYGICGDVQSAEDLFNSIHSNQRDVVSIGAMMKCMINNDRNERAIDLYRSSNSNRRDIALHCLAIKAFANLGDFKMAQYVIETESQTLNSVEFVSAMIYYFGKSGDVDSAKDAFLSVPDHRKDIVMINNMLMALHLNGYNEECMDLWKRLESETDLDHLRPNVISFCNALIACTNGSMLEMGRMIHSRLGEAKNEWMMRDGQIQTLLINLYGACGELEKCKEIFEEMKVTMQGVTVWNAMIQALGEHGEVQSVRTVFEELCNQKRAGLNLDRNTFVSMINIYGHCGELEAAMDLWESKIDNDKMKYDDRVIGALLDVLSRQGMLAEAQQIMEKVPNTE